jgi:hypothetical protein
MAMWETIQARVLVLRWAHFSSKRGNTFMSTKRRLREKIDLSFLDVSPTRTLSSHVPDALLASMYRGDHRRSEGTRKRLFASIVESDRSRVGSEEALVPCWYVARHMTVPPPIWLSLSWPAMEDRFCAIVEIFLGVRGVCLHWERMLFPAFVL